MAKIKLIGLAASRALRVIWMLNELGLPFEHDPVSFADGKAKSPPYSDWNPMGRIPTLLVDDFAIFESLAINLYLVEEFGGPLAPTTSHERGIAAQWSLWAMSDVDGPITAWAFNSFIKPEAERDAALAASSLAALQRPLAALEKSLNGKQYLMSDRFTVADLNTAGVLYRALVMDLAAYPNVARWLHRCWSREAAIAARRARGDKV
jgi:glutathione S-transferase